MLYGDPGPSPVQIRVVAGDLSFSSHPVVVGHFAGDAIVGAEGQLDGALGGALGRRYLLGAYPGAVGTTAFVPAADGSGRPGMVVGLGDMGEFSPGALRDALVAGLIDLRLAHAGAGVSLVTLGNRSGAVSTSDAMAATLSALDEAARRFATAGLGRFDEVQLFALHEDSAHRLWHTLRQLLGALDAGHGFALAPAVGYGAGVRRRIVAGQDPDLWRAVQVQALSDGTGFRFTEAGGRARAEGHLVGTDRSFLAELIGAAGQRKLQATPTRALFQLVWPNELKRQSREDRNLRLILDDAAAAIPFELMDDRPAPAEGETPGCPPCVRRGLLRQLIQTRFAPPAGLGSRGVAGSRRALVIGDPRGGPPAPDFGPLSGARKEAEEVADLLERNGFAVTRLIGEGVTPDQVVEHVLRGGWTVLHVSAHGVYRYAFRTDREEAKAAGWDGRRATYPGERHTGVVLADKLTLSPTLIQAMPDPPALAFLNCCELGTVDADDEAAVRAAARPEFAAGFAAELIALGARAVVAAGWEVSDAGALVFARTFYSQMLGEGQGYGDAVRFARHAVWKAQPEDATWGAYQCYGEPDWRLAAAPPAGRARLSPDFASPAEAVQALLTIAERARVGAGRSDAAARLAGELAETEAVLAASGWTDAAGVAEALAGAHLALGDEAQARDLFARALATDAAPSLKAVEEVVHLDIRIGGRDGDIARVVGGRERLQTLCVAAGETPVRLDLIASATRREATLAGEDGRDTALAAMAAAYGRSLDLYRERSAPGAYYPAMLRATALLLLALRSGGDRGEAMGALADLDRAFETADASADAFWLRTSRIARDVLGALAEDGCTPGRQATVAAEWRELWASCGSAGQRASVAEHIGFIADMLGARPQGEWVRALAGTVGS